MIEQMEEFLKILEKLPKEVKNEFWKKLFGVFAKKPLEVFKKKREKEFYFEGGQI